MSIISKKILAMFLAVSAIAFFTACSGEETPSSSESAVVEQKYEMIAGEWYYVQHELIYEFDEEGKYSFTEPTGITEGNYSFDGETLILDYDTETPKTAQYKQLDGKEEHVLYFDGIEGYFYFNDRVPYEEETPTGENIFLGDWVSFDGNHMYVISLEGKYTAISSYHGDFTFDGTNIEIDYYETGTESGVLVDGKVIINDVQYDIENLVSNKGVENPTPEMSMISGEWVEEINTNPDPYGSRVYYFFPDGTCTYVHLYEGEYTYDGDAISLSGSFTGKYDPEENAIVLDDMGGTYYYN